MLGVVAREQQISIVLLAAFSDGLKTLTVSDEDNPLIHEPERKPKKGG